MRTRYDAPGLMPCVSTVAPEGAGDFFERLLSVKRELYDLSFQLQFSIHTTDERLRERLVPCRKWDFGRMAEYGARFHGGRGRKVALNFALSPDAPVDAGVLAQHFDPGRFMVKLTPVNPTENARNRGLVSSLAPGFEEGTHPVVRSLTRAGYEVVISIGEPEENALGSNCGQVVGLWKKAQGAGRTAQG